MMEREELFRKVRESKDIASLANNLTIKRFYAGLVKWSVGIIPFMILALVVNGGIAFDITMGCVYLSMFVYYGLQKSYSELEVYAYKYFGTKDALDNTMKSSELILRTEKEMKETTNEEEKNRIYDEMVKQLDDLYGKGNHLFISEKEAKIKQKQIQIQKNLKEAKENYKNRVKDIDKEADRQAKDILNQWFTPVVAVYDELINLVKMQELLQYNTDGTKEEREKRKEENANKIEDQIIIVNNAIREVRKKYTEISKDVDLKDELNVESQIVKKLYEFAIKADGSQETNGLCTLLSICVNQDMIFYPQYRHGKVMVALKRSYELLKSIGLHHPDVDLEKYQSYCAYVVQRRMWELSKEGQKVIAREKKEEEKRKKEKLKEQERQRKAREREIERMNRRNEKSLERYKKTGRYY